MAAALAKCSQAVGNRRLSEKLPTTCITKQYTLNINKSLAKKLEATRRTSVTYKITDGGITAKADAVSFELLRAAIIQYFSDMPKDKGLPKVTTSKDKKGSDVQTTIKASYCQPDLFPYTINMYHTRSTFLVNGKGMSQFMESDLRNIHSIVETATIEGSPINIKELNAILAVQLEMLLNTQDNAYGQSVKNNSRSEIDNSRSEIANSSDIRCVKCNRNCATRSVFCERNHHWIHYRCAKLSQDVINQIEEDSSFSFTCDECERLGNQHSKSPEANKLVIPSTILSPLCKTVKENILKSIAEDILQEESDINDCCGCGDSLIGGDPVICELCGGNCHYKCMNNPVEAAVCIACEASVSQVDSQLAANADASIECEMDNHSVNHTIQLLPNRKLNLTESNINSSSPIVVSPEKLTLNSNLEVNKNKNQVSVSHKNLNASCLLVTDHKDSASQTDGISLTEYQKKMKELNSKEKALNKKEFELSNVTKQLASAKVAMVSLERTISELQQENELLKSNLVLAKSSKDSYTQLKINSNCENETTLQSIERRLNSLEMESLKARIANIESMVRNKNTSNCDNTQDNTHRNSKCMSSLVNQHTVTKFPNISERLDTHERSYGNVHNKPQSLNDSTNNSQLADRANRRPVSVAEHDTIIIDEDCNKGGDAGDLAESTDYVGMNQMEQGHQTGQSRVASFVGHNPTTTADRAGDKLHTLQQAPVMHNPINPQNGGHHPAMVGVNPQRLPVQPFLYQAMLPQAPPWNQMRYLYPQQMLANNHQIRQRLYQ